MRPYLSELSRVQRINLDFTINSGQVFLWKRHGRFWYGIDGQNVLKCDSTGVNSSYQDDRTDFFRAGDKLAEITKSISKDRTVRKAVARYSGLRLLRQNPFQCMVTFIASSNASIQKIRASLEGICTGFGERICFDGLEFCLFPEPRRLAEASLREMKECGLGYRSRYVMEASKRAADGAIDFESIRGMNYYGAKEELRAVPGIGNKVADCILLFSLDKHEAFPLDRWMIKILQRYYPKKFEIRTSSISDRQYDRIHDKAVDYFGPYAGYAQQFLFKMEREERSKRWL